MSKTNEKIIAKLNQILEMEISGVVRYLHYSFMIMGPNRIPIQKWFHDQAQEGYQHATMVGEKITALGGHPSLNVSKVPETKTHAVLDILKESLVFEEKAIELYKKVRDLSPAYAEVNMNIGILYARLSEKETTGPKKIELMEEALKYVQEQEKWDYRGKAALKANEMRMRLRSVIYRTKLEMKDKQTSASK